MTTDSNREAFEDGPGLEGTALGEMPKRIFEY